MFGRLGKKAFSFLFCGILFLACSNSLRNSSEYASVNDNQTIEVEGGDARVGYDQNTYGSDDINTNSDIGTIRLTGCIETCNKCMGYGMLQDGIYGQPKICKFCWISTNMRVQQGWTGFDGRYGQVDAVFNTLPADYFDELDWNANGDYDNNSTEQIEAQISRHEENIAQLEHQLEYIDGSISRTQIEQQIIEEQYEIKRQKAILNGM